MKLGLIVCCFCDKSVEKHVLWDHIAQDIDYRPFDCETCAQTFINKSELTEHEIKSDGHKGNYVSEIASLIQIYFSTNSAPYKQIKILRGKKIQIERKKNCLK